MALSNRSFLLGVIAGLNLAAVVWLFGHPGNVLPVGWAATSDSNNKYVAGVGEQSGGLTVLYVINTEMDRLCTYEYKGGQLNLRGARNIKFDFMLDVFPPNSQKPDPAQVHELVKKP